MTFSAYVKKLLLGLLALGLLAFVVIWAFSDQLPKQIRLTFPRSGTATTSEDLSQQTHQEIIESIDAEAAALDSEYNFQGELTNDTLENPDFTSELNSPVE